MSRTDDLERKLRQSELPGVVPGSHQSRLKQALVNQMQLVSKEPEMTRFRIVFSSRPLRIAASFAVVVSLMATGWAAETVYEAISKRYWQTETLLDQQWPDADGTRVWGTQTIIGKIVEAEAPPTDGPNFKAIKKLIPERKYKFVRTFEEPAGVTNYLYHFTLPDGTVDSMNFLIPLDQCSSWDDYVQKLRAHNEQRHRRIQQAIARGQFRLLDVTLLRAHICRDAQTGEMLHVLCIDGTDNKQTAVVSPQPAHETNDRYETSWDEHLAAIENGSRQLLELEAVQQFKYEVTLLDGSTTVFEFGGDAPLKKPD